MARVTGWTKDGTQLFSLSGAGVLNGTVDYLGNGHYMVCSEEGITLHELASAPGGSMNMFKIGNLHFFNDNQTGVGIAINHSYLPDGKQDSGGYAEGLDGQQVYVAFRVAGEPTHWRLWLFDIDQGGIGLTPIKLMKNFFTNVVAGLGWNGHQLYLALTGEGTFIRQYEVGGGIAHNVKAYTEIGTQNDFCFDGQDFFVLGNNTVNHFEQGNFNNLKKNWSHGLTNPSGIATDGNILVILSQS